MHGLLGPGQVACECEKHEYLKLVQPATRISCKSFTMRESFLLQAQTDHCDQNSRRSYTVFFSVGLVGFGWVLGWFTRLGLKISSVFIGLQFWVSLVASNELICLGGYGNVVL